MTTATKRMLDAGYEAAHVLAKHNGKGFMFGWAPKEQVEEGMGVIYHAMETQRIADEAQAKLAASGISTAPGVAHSGVAPSDHAAPDPKPTT